MRGARRIFAERSVPGPTGPLLGEEEPLALPPGPRNPRGAKIHSLRLCCLGFAAPGKQASGLFSARTGRQAPAAGFSVRKTFLADLPPVEDRRSDRQICPRGGLGGGRIPPPIRLTHSCVSPARPGQGYLQTVSASCKICRNTLIRALYT